MAAMMAAVLTQAPPVLAVITGRGPTSSCRGAVTRRHPPSLLLPKACLRAAACLWHRERTAASSAPERLPHRRHALCSRSGVNFIGGGSASEVGLTPRSRLG